MSLGRSAVPLHIEVLKFRTALRGREGLHPRTASACEALAAALTDEFDIKKERYHSSVRLGVSKRTLQNRVNYQKRKREVAEERVQKLTADRFEGRIQHIWFVRVAFADPGITPRSLSEFCKSFFETSARAISAPYIGQVRDAFAQIIKNFNREAVKQLGRVLPCGGRACPGQMEFSAPVFIQHMHDEASMRMRSFDASLPERIVRARSSKIQNNCVSIRSQNTQMQWLTELQPLL